jgi:hypothetical protein
MVRITSAESNCMRRCCYLMLVTYLLGRGNSLLVPRAAAALKLSCVNGVLAYDGVERRTIVDDHIPTHVWQQEAERHHKEIDDLLYPKYSSLRRRRATPTYENALWARSHQVADHPIYNFLHNYYQYSVEDLRKYSPGIGIVLNGASANPECGLLDQSCLTFMEAGAVYDIRLLLGRLRTKKAWEFFVRQRDVLSNSVSKPAFFGCFGMHEWAMLYSGNGTTVKGHQKLPLRVSQETIDAVVGAPGQLRCTHFDAYRFFQPAAKPLNAIKPLTRDLQQRYEQPGCIHANMDLFKYAYSLYPFVSSALLVATIRLALEARKVDMRASPYDVSAYEGCEEPICVETAQGRKLYVAEQERIAAMAAPLRKQLCEVYDFVMGAFLSRHGDKHPSQS